MGKKISLTRLLNEIKLANKKIDKKLNEDITYFDVMSSGRLKTYKTTEDMKQKVDAHIKSISDLIVNRDNYKRILLKANNTTTIKVGDVELTIAEAIAKKDTISQEQRLVREMRNQLIRAENTVQMLENDNEEKLDNLIVASIGKEKKTDASEIESVSKVFRDNNKVSIVDASGVEKLLVEKENYLEEFINNIDFALSEINAKTEVKI
jgi:hypothetical protein